MFIFIYVYLFLQIRKKIKISDDAEGFCAWEPMGLFCTVGGIFVAQLL